MIEPAGLLTVMAVQVPEGECDGMKVERFTVTGLRFRDFLYALEGRATTPGTYTGLWERKAGLGDRSYAEAETANPGHVKVMSFDSVTNPKELADDLILMAGLG